MQVLVEGLPYDAVAVDEDVKLFKHRVDVGVHLLLAALLHDDQSAAALLDILTHVFQLLACERCSGTSEQQEVSLGHLLIGELFLVDFAL